MHLSEKEKRLLVSAIRNQVSHLNECAAMADERGKADDRDAFHKNAEALQAIEPRLCEGDDPIPRCSESEHPSFDGKRCKELYRPSRDKMGNWLPLFADPQAMASELFERVLMEFPSVHPYDLAESMCSILGFDAVRAHNRNTRAFDVRPTVKADEERTDGEV